MQTILGSVGAIGNELARAVMLFMLVFCHSFLVYAGIVEKTYYFEHFTIETVGNYQTVNFENTMLSGIPGEPLLPWNEVVLMLPPGEAAGSVEIIFGDETAIPGKFNLHPAQAARPVSMGRSGEFLQNRQVYRQNGVYPMQAQGRLLTQYLDGYALALSTFTPLRYNPRKGTVTYFKKITVRIQTHADKSSQEALNQIIPAAGMRRHVSSFAQNPEMISFYPERDNPLTAYQYLIISPVAFKNEFQPMISLYTTKGITVRVVTTDSIYAAMTGTDSQEKIRNFIISQRQNHSIEYVLLAGNPPLVPSRGFYCYVQSGGGYTDYNIPADIYYSGLNGNYDVDGDDIYGEVTDNPDLLPDISVGRFTVNDTAELHRMIHKTVSYLTSPVLGELNNPMLVGEELYANPVTFGGSYMDLLVNDHTDNGYFTHGIPSATNNIEKLYDTLISLTPFNYWAWSSSTLLTRLNQGKSFIHHLGHANYTYMMRLSMSQIVNSNFPAVNGITHNYQLLYTQGCNDGAFDYPGGCIAAKAVTIDNFLVAGVFNTRYGWFNEGTTEGPSEHLEREFVSAVYNDTTPEKHLGTAHMISKIEAAPWISLPGEFEPGARRWVQYDCTVFGDPALEIWTGDPAATWTGNIDSNWNTPGNWTPACIPAGLYNVTIGPGLHQPVITTSNATFCRNLTILNGGNLTINPGKSLVVYGTVTLAP